MVVPSGQFEVGEILYEKFKIQKLKDWWNNTYN